MNKHESTTQKGLFFWAEKVNSEYDNLPICYMVVSQVEGFPASEAWDDWFACKSDADEISRKLAKGEL